jgi:MFS family permease
MDASSTSRQADGGSFGDLSRIQLSLAPTGMALALLTVTSDLVVSLLLCGKAGVLPIPLHGMNQLIVTRGFLGLRNGAIIALTFTLVADLFPPSELPPNRMWTIFQPNGDREGHDRSHGLP